MDKAAIYMLAFVLGVCIAFSGGVVLGAKAGTNVTYHSVIRECSAHNNFATKAGYVVECFVVERPTD